MMYYIKRIIARKNQTGSVVEIQKTKVNQERIVRIARELGLETDAIFPVKSAIYFGKIKDDSPKNVRQLLQEQVDMLNEMFPKLYWNEYVAEHTKMYDNWKDVSDVLSELEKIKVFLDKNKKYHGISGEELQDKYNYFNNKKLFDYSWRSWGSLMSAYMNTKKKERKYDYMSYYI
jgi:hypothetical protein